MRAILAGCLALAPGLGPAGQEPALDQAQALLQDQRTRPDALAFERAKGILTERIACDPGDARAWTLLAWARMSEHRFAAAWDAAQTADSLAPDTPEALALATDALVELGRYGEAVDLAQRLLDLDPGVPAWVRAGRLRYLHGDLPGAIVLLTQAAGAAGTRGEAAAWVRIELARLYLDDGNLDAAAAALAWAELALPGHPGLPAARARLLDAQGDPTGALALYRQALAARPSAEEALTAWRLARRLGRWGEARHLAALLDGLARLDAGGLSRRALAEHFAEAGDIARALVLAREELIQRPDLYSHATLARVLAGAGDLDAARVHARAALALNTADPRLRSDMGAILGAAGAGP